MNISELVYDAHAMSKSKGWYDPDVGTPNIPEKLALVHSEVSEALEDYRNGIMTTYKDENGKPHGFATELADVMIRLADLAGYLNIDLETEIAEKMAFNATRSHRHGGKRC
jgi:NTP pyrophosphatase (non-canonical NTP hydrolase)